MTTLVVGPTPGGVVISKGGRFGVLPSEFPTLGDFDSPLENDAPSGGWLSTDEVSWRLESVAAGGTVVADDFGGWQRTGAADGTYVSTYRVWVARAGVVTSNTYTITDTVGSVGAVDLTVSSAASSTGLSSVALTSGNTLSVQAASSATSISSVAVTQRNVLTVSAAVSSTALSAVAIPGGATYPDPSNVRAGVMYGPTGTEYTGTMTGGGDEGGFMDITTGRRVRLVSGVVMSL